MRSTERAEDIATMFGCRSAVLKGLAVLRHQHCNLSVIEVAHVGYSHTVKTIVHKILQTLEQTTLGRCLVGLLGCQGKILVHSLVIVSQAIYMTALLHLVENLGSGTGKHFIKETHIVVAKKIGKSFVSHILVQHRESGILDIVVACKIYRNLVRSRIVPTLGSKFLGIILLLGIKFVRVVEKFYIGIQSSCRLVGLCRHSCQLVVAVQICGSWVACIVTRNRGLTIGWIGKTILPCPLILLGIEILVTALEIDISTFGASGNRSIIATLIISEILIAITLEAVFLDKRTSFGVHFVSHARTHTLSLSAYYIFIITQCTVLGNRTLAGVLVHGCQQGTSSKPIALLHIGANVEHNISKFCVIVARAIENIVDKLHLAAVQRLAFGLLVHSV